MLEPGKFYHIYNRGNNKEILFKEDRNFFYFRDLWQQRLSSFTTTYACCLLSNHFHYFIRINENAYEICGEKDASAFISQKFSNFFNGYTKAVNKAYNRTGSLFQEKFRRKEIKDELHFARVICYIHTNAQKHGIVKDFKQYPYSSYRSVIKKWEDSEHKEYLKEWFGDKDGFIRMHDDYVADANWNNHILEMESDDD